VTATLIDNAVGEIIWWAGRGAGAARRNSRRQEKPELGMAEMAMRGRGPEQRFGDDPRPLSGGSLGSPRAGVRQQDARHAYGRSQAGDRRRPAKGQVSQ
jgi:hypothetical protein